MSRSHTRPLVLGVVVLALTALLAGCTDAGSSELTASMPSGERPEQPPALEGMPSPTPGDLEEELDAFEQQLQEELEGLGLDDFDLDDLQVDDLEIDGASECVEVTLGYGRLVALAFQGPEAAAETEQVLAELRAILPPDLADEMQVISDKLGEASDAGFIEVAGLLSDPEFSDANTAIGEWLETGCGVAGG